MTCVRSDMSVAKLGFGPVCFLIRTSFPGPPQPLTSQTWCRPRASAFTVSDLSDLTARTESYRTLSIDTISLETAVEVAGTPQASRCCPVLWREDGEFQVTVCRVRSRIWVEPDIPQPHMAET